MKSSGLLLKNTEKTLAQLAIKWVMQFPGITAPIVGGRTDKQVLENVGACGWKMEQSDFEKINTLSKDFLETNASLQSLFLILLSLSRNNPCCYKIKKAGVLL